jgi:hypothetical protein
MIPWAAAAAGSATASPHEALIEIGKGTADADGLHRCTVKGQSVVEITDFRVAHGLLLDKLKLDPPAQPPPRITADQARLPTSL